MKPNFSPSLYHSVISGVGGKKKRAAIHLSAPGHKRIKKLSAKIKISFLRPGEKASPGRKNRRISFKGE